MVLPHEKCLLVGVAESCTFSSPPEKKQMPGCAKGSVSFLQSSRTWSGLTCIHPNEHACEEMRAADFEVCSTAVALKREHTHRHTHSVEIEMLCALTQTSHSHKKKKKKNIGGLLQCCFALLSKPVTISICAVLDRASVCPCHYCTG